MEKTSISGMPQLIKWINQPDMPIWWRYSVKLLIKKQEADKDDIDFIIRIARREAGFIDDDIDLNILGTPASDDGFSTDESPVSLDSIENIVNVGALASNQRIDFSKGLTVIYGDNGTGKSSYTRILKNSCMTRGSLPKVTGNIFYKHTEIPSAQITFSLENATKTISWSEDSPHNKALKSIRVFDSRSASHYLREDGTVEYKPASLHILDALTKICSKVKLHIEEKIVEQKESCNIPELDKTTKTGEFLSKLSYRTSRKVIDSHDIKNKELKELESLFVELPKLKSQSSDEIKKNLLLQINRYTPVYNEICNISKMLSNDVISQIEELKNNYTTKTRVAQIVREKIFSTLPLDGIGSDLWVPIWNAARTFCEQSGPGNFPIEEDGICPLCLQKITKRSAEQMHSFEDFVKDTTQAEALKAKKSFLSKLNEIERFTANLSIFGSIISEISDQFDNNIEIRNKILSFEKTFDERKKLILSLKVKPIESDIPQFDQSIIYILDNLLKKLNKTLELVKDDETLQRTIMEKECRYKELSAKKTFSENKNNIQNEVKRLIRLRFYEQIKKSTRTNKITQITKELNSQTVIASLAKSFQEEIKFLGFSYFKVKAHTKAKLGKPLWGIELIDSQTNSVSLIASEGEARCIALACSLAELKADNRNSGIIFDDPVTSLDHRWREKIAERLVRETANRQVIIFTHDLIFLKLIQENVASHEIKAFSYFFLDRTRNKVGLVRESFPWDGMTIKQRIAKLSEDVLKLKGSFQNETEVEYQEKAKSFYGYLREAWEQLVEEVLLNGSVRRFCRGISTKPLKQLINDITVEDYTRIEENMSLCSIYFTGHNNASGVHVSCPPIDELERHFEILQDYRKILAKRR